MSFVMLFPLNSSRVETWVLDFPEMHWALPGGWHGQNPHLKVISLDWTYARDKCKLNNFINKFYMWEWRESAVSKSAKQNMSRERWWCHSREHASKNSSKNSSSVHWKKKQKTFSWRKNSVLIEFLKHRGVRTSGYVNSGNFLKPEDYL